MPLKLGHVTWGRYVARKPTKHTVLYRDAFAAFALLLLLLL